MAPEDFSPPDLMPDLDLSHEELLVSQLEVYANDFYQVVAKFNDMRHRYQSLEAKHKGLLDAGQLMARVYANANEFAVLTNAAGDFLATDDAAACAFGIGRTGLRNFYEVLPQAQAREAQAWMAGGNNIGHDGWVSFELGLNGLTESEMNVAMHPCYVELGGQPCCLWTGQMTKKACLTDRVKSAKSQRQGSGQLGVLVLNLKGDLLACDTALQTFCGKSFTQLQTAWPGQLNMLPAGICHYADLVQLVLDKGGWQGQVGWQLAAGKHAPVGMTLRVLHHADGSQAAIAASLTEGDNAGQQLLQNSSATKHGTGLLPLRSFERGMRQKLAYSFQQADLAYLVMFEIDASGKPLLALEPAKRQPLESRLVRRIQTSIRGCDLATELATGSFAVFLDASEFKTQAMEVMLRLKKTLYAPCVINEEMVSVSLSMAYVKIDRPDFVMQELLIEADMAMKLSRTQGLGAICSLDDMDVCLTAQRADFH